MEIHYVHFRVSGKVQGVSYRQSTLRIAQSLEIHGWVKNLPDGRVETYAEGSPTALDELLKWCERGPAHARVEKIEILEREKGSARFTEFSIHR